MTRMTISRSSLAVLAALLAAPAAGASAQDTLQTTEGRRHLVAEGETLWAIAQVYLGDPFLWPEIYRINTLVVEDPHWIFPGEVLRLVPPDTTTVAVAEPERPVEPEGEVAAGAQGVERAPEPEPEVEAPEVELPDAAPPPPPPVTEDAPTIFAQQARDRSGPSVLPFSARMAYRPVRAGDFYAAGFLTEGDRLPWATVRGPVQGGRVVAGRVEIASATIFQRVRITGPEGATYQIGDSLLTARLQREVPSWGRVVVPTGIVRIVHVSGREVLAEVVTQFARVADGQVAMPVEPFRNPGPVRPQPVEEGMEGHVIEVRDEHPVPIQMDVVFIDLGRQDGVVPGDVFEVIRPSELVADQPPERLAELHIVHVREQSAAGLLVRINAPGTGAGLPVRLIRKMPS